MTENTYTTTMGLELKLRPVSTTRLNSTSKKVEKEFRTADEPIDVPTYETETVGGAVQVYKHDEKTEKTPEQQKVWDAHLDAVERMGAEQSKRSLSLMLRHGVEFEMPEDDSWEAEHEYDGLEVPTDAREKKLHYLTTEVLVTLRDTKEVSRRIVMLSIEGIDEETRAGIEASFRDSLQEPDGTEAGGTDDQEG